MIFSIKKKEKIYFKNYKILNDTLQVDIIYK